MRTLKKCAGGCGRYVLVVETFELLSYCSTCFQSGVKGGTLSEIEDANTPGKAEKKNGQ